MAKEKTGVVLEFNGWGNFRHYRCVGCNSVVYPLPTPTGCHDGLPTRFCKVCGNKLANETKIFIYDWPKRRKLNKEHLESLFKEAVIL